MGEPWYQISGPNATYVRKNLLDRKINNCNLHNKTWHINAYKDVLRTVITDNLKFGSWRGYATFGLDSYLQQMIDIHWGEKLKQYNKSMSILSRNLRHHILPFLYRPKGNIAQKMLHKYYL